MNLRTVSIWLRLGFSDSLVSTRYVEILACLGDLEIHSRIDFIKYVSV